MPVEYLTSFPAYLTGFLEVFFTGNMPCAVAIQNWVWVFDPVKQAI